MNSDQLNKCLRSELSAVETYQQAVEKDRQKFGHETEFQTLVSISNRSSRGGVAA